MQSDVWRIVPYWTRLQVGVLHKHSKKQPWATTVHMRHDFATKVQMANEVVSCRIFVYSLSCAVHRILEQKFAPSGCYPVSTFHMS